MGDEKFRALYRAGEYSLLTRRIIQSGLSLIEYCIQYVNKVGPGSILTTLCAFKDCKHTLDWSICSYCYYCFTSKRPCWIMGEDEEYNPFKSSVSSDGRLMLMQPNDTDECNCSLAGIKHRQVPNKEEKEITP